MIATQAARLSQITEELLLASQLDRGELTLAARAGRRRASSARGRSDGPTRLARHRGRDRSRRHRTASGDRDRIQQVLVNLLDNALKYGAEPVEVGVEQANGGVPAAVSRPRPGNPFGRPARSSRSSTASYPQLTPRAGGHGLGLYISRELVRRMDGRLIVRSLPGSGATFVVDLPGAPAG